MLRGTTLIGVALAAYAAITAIGLIRTDWSDSIQTEGSGLSVLFGACAGFMALAFFAKPAFFPSTPLSRFGLLSFAASWMLAMVVNLAIVLIRMKPSPAQSFYEVAIDIFSWVVVTLIFSIPALIALALDRFTHTTS